MENIKIKCNMCDWEGKEEDITLKGEIEYCPKCGKTGYLMDNEKCSICKECIGLPKWYLNEDEPIKPVCEDCYIETLAEKL